jgi:hypothetical protein
MTNRIYTELTGHTNSTDLLTKADGDALYAAVGTVSDSTIALDDTFGAAIDGVTDDAAAFTAFQAYRISLKITGYGYGNGIPKGRLTLGVSYQGSTTDLYGSGILEGEGGSIDAGSGTVLKYPDNTVGIRLQFVNQGSGYGTSGDSTVGVSTQSSSSGTILRNFAMKFPNAGRDVNYPAIHPKAPFVAEDLFIDGPRGYCITANAQLAGTPPSFTTAYGNVAGSQIWRCTFQNAMGGVKLQGADASVCTIFGCTTTAVSEYAYADYTQFGCLWLGNKAEAGCATGGWHTDPAQSSAHPTIIHGYDETGNPTPTFSQGTLRLGGNWGNGGTGGGYVYASGDGVRCNKLASDTTLEAIGAANIGPTTGTATDGSLTINSTNTSSVIAGYTYSAGVPTLRGTITFKTGFGIMLDCVASSSIRLRYAGTDVAIVDNTGIDLQAVALKVSGTSAIDSSRNGSFVAITATGSIKSSHATNGIGYATGAGGTATQATSRTTGVTLNKACGQITLVSAAGSTSWQTFTVTNSAVAATDVIHVAQASGTDLYQIHVTNVAAGSFKISFATTGGTTTEQPVFNFAVVKGVSS